MKLTSPVWSSLIFWSHSLNLSLNSIRWWRADAFARRMWSPSQRAERIAGNTECAGIAWAKLNEAVRRLIQLGERSEHA